MPEDTGRVVRYNIDDPDDFTFLLNNGWIWKIGAEGYQKAADAVIRDPSLINEYTPDEVLAAAQPDPEEDAWA